MYNKGVKIVRTKDSGLLVLVLLFFCVTVFNNNSQAQTSETTDFGIVVEPETYVPETYAATAPITPGSRVRMIAVGGDPLDYYEWRINGRTINQYSGIGQQVIELSIENRSLDVSVSVIRAGEAYKTDKTTIKPNPVDLVLYQDHPTRGPLFNNGLSSIMRTTATTVSLVGVPYGAPETDPTLRWQIGNSGLFSVPVASIVPDNNNREVVSARYAGSLFGSRPSKSVEVQFATID